MGLSAANETNPSMHRNGGALHATHTIRSEPHNALALPPLDTRPAPGRALPRHSPSTSGACLLPVATSWHPDAAWSLHQPEEQPGCMLSPAEALQLSAAAAVASDQDSAGQDRDDADTAPGYGYLSQGKDVAKPRHRASCGSAASDHRAAIPVNLVKTESLSGAPGVELLPLDMSEELAALERALSLPSSAEELQEGLSVSEIDNDLIKCIRKRGKGGRNPASDARLDPNIDPKKAMRIMANRMSAARSKLRQKLAQEGQRVKLDMLALQKSKLSQEIESLEQLCMEMEEAQVGKVSDNPITPNQAPGWPSHHRLPSEDTDKQNSPLSSNSNAQPAPMDPAADHFMAGLPQLSAPVLNLNHILPPDAQQQHHHHLQLQASQHHMDSYSQRGADEHSDPFAMHLASQPPALMMTRQPGQSQAPPGYCSQQGHMPPDQE